MKRLFYSVVLFLMGTVLSCLSSCLRDWTDPPIVPMYGVPLT